MEQTASDTEAQILEAAHRVFLRRGTAGARTQEIADEAGVNKALLHYYYRTKEKLAQAVLLRAAATFFPKMMSTLASDLPLRDKLQKVIEVELDMLEANPYLPGYLISEFQYRIADLRALLQTVIPIATFRKNVLGTLQSQIDAEVEAGTMRPTRAEDLVVSLMAQLVFPFAAAPMLEVVLDLDEEARRAMVQRRRTELADAILRSLRP
jgi:AcrR family transcriptional regulator